LFVITIWYFNYAIENEIWKKKGEVIHCDVISYYSYLPMAFIQKDLTQKYNPLPYSWNIELNNINIVKTSMGVAYLYSPFFFAAYAYSKVFNVDMEGGFSTVFAFSLYFGSVIYCLLAFFLLRKLLLKYFSDIAVSFTLFTIALGTNLYVYSLVEAPYSHVYSFLIIIAFVYYTIKWHNNPSVLNSLIIGLISGVISLIRPVYVILLIFFVLYDIKSVGDLKTKWLLYLMNYKKIIIVLFIALLVWVPQILYWKYVADSFFIYSYGDESFFWMQPRVILVLFCYRCGWLIYSPLMIFSLIGFLLLRKQMKSFNIAVIAFFIINLYIMSCWWNWWYVGYGKRPMIDIYGILAIPLTAFYNYIFSKKLFLKIFVTTLLIFFIYFNIFQVWQFRHAIVHYDSMTKKAYWYSLFKKNVSSEFWNEYLQTPDYDGAMKGKTR